MLMTEFNLSDAIAVARKESHKKGLEQGIEKGLKKGREEGRKEKLKIARNLLAEGATFDFIQKITGLDVGSIEKL